MVPRLFKIKHYFSCIQIVNCTVCIMVRLVLNIFSVLFFLLSLWFFITDQIQQKTNSMLFGEVWFNNSPNTLQLAEVIIDRYIDPCSLLTILGCPSFLWHPTISSVLLLPASLVFLTAGVFMLIISQWLPKKRSRRNVYSLDRNKR